MLVGSCFSGFSNVYQVSYQYMIYQAWEFESGDTQEKWVPVLLDINNTNSVYFYGADTSELTIYPSLFQAFPNAYKWKVELHLKTYSYTNGLSVGSSSIVLHSNRLPRSGYCLISPGAGISHDTWFTITCSNWVDDDGWIAKYSYYGKLHSAVFFAADHLQLKLCRVLKLTTWTMKSTTDWASTQTAY